MGSESISSIFDKHQVLNATARAERPAGFKKRIENTSPVFMSSSIPIGYHIFQLSRVTWLAASRRPLKPNERRRRCAPLLDSQIPLVHRTQTTEAGRVGAEPGTAAQRKLICSRTDGSPSHTHPPNHQPASHEGAEQVGEGTQAEQRMIFIEYEMSISWNNRTLQAGRRILLPLTCCSLFGALVHQRHPAASRQ